MVENQIEEEMDNEMQAATVEIYELEPKLFKGAYIGDRF